jgi:hypothetical protein
MEPTSTWIGRAAAAALFALVFETSLVEAASVYISPTGNDVNACSQAAPCRTIQRGYNVAAPGDTIEVSAGTYASETLVGTKAAPGVVFRPTSGASVTLGELTIRATGLEFRDLRINGWKAQREADRVSFRNVVHAGFWAIWSAANVTLLGGETFCPGADNYCDYDPQISEESGARVAPSNILIDGMYFHDWRRPPGSDWHTECLQVGAGVNVTIRNSRFIRCATHDIFIRSWGGINGGIHELRGWTIENNFFATTDAGFYAIQFVNDLGSGTADFLVRNNSFLQGVYIDGAKTAVTMVNNVLSEQVTWGCSAKVYSHNIYETLLGTGSKCGVTDIVTPVTYVNRATLDLRVVAGSPAINAGDPLNFPLLDIDGRTRTGVPDIGAAEFGDAFRPAAPTGLTIR